MGDRFELFRDAATAAFGENLVMAAAYGASDGDGASAVVVVDQIKPESLRAFRQKAIPLRKAGLPTPAIFTEEHLRGSADVFPLDFLLMKKGRRIVAGRDIVDEIVVSNENLAHQVEFEIAGKLLSVRRLYLESKDSRELATIVASIVPGIVHAARGLIFLLGLEVPASAQGVVEALASRVGDGGVPTLARLAAQQAVPTAKAEETLFALLDDLERLRALADRVHADR